MSSSAQQPAVVPARSDGVPAQVVRRSRKDQYSKSGMMLMRQGARQLIRNRAPVLAAALAYRTIFSLIPLLVLSLVVLRAFYGERGIRQALDGVMGFTGLSELAIRATAHGAEVSEGGGVEIVGPIAPDWAAPAADGVNTVSEWIEQFVNRAVEQIAAVNFGAITVVGIAVLIYAAISLLIQMEQSFNSICRAPGGRRWVVRFTNYWTLLTLGSVVLAAGVSASQGFEKMVEGLPPWASWSAPSLHAFASIVLTWLLLLFAYMRMPNFRLRFAPAGVGAFVAAVLWSLARFGLVQFFDLITGRNIFIYGSLALIPLFLLWVYVTWLVVLFGLEVAYLLHTFDPSDPLPDESPSARVIDPAAAVLLMRVIADRFAAGRAPEAGELSERIGVPGDLTQKMLDVLTRGGLLHRVSRDADRDGYTLARPPDSILVTDVLTPIYEMIPQRAGHPAAEGLASLREAFNASFRGKTLAAIET